MPSCPTKVSFSLLPSCPVKYFLSPSYLPVLSRFPFHLVPSCQGFLSPSYLPVFSRFTFSLLPFFPLGVSFPLRAFLSCQSFFLPRAFVSYQSKTNGRKSRDNIPLTSCRVFVVATLKDLRVPHLVQVGYNVCVIKLLNRRFYILIDCPSCITIFQSESCRP